MRWLLDTDVVVQAIRARPQAVRQRLEKLSPDDVAISAITVAELSYGAEKSEDPQKTRAAFEAFLDPFEILSFDEAAAHEHGRLRFGLRRQPIGDRDLFIAAIALARKLKLVTGNVREFHRVTGLEVEDWTR